MSTNVYLKAQFIRSIPTEGVYRVQVDIIDVINIDFDVLVFDYEHDTFSRVATVYDLESYPAGKSLAAYRDLDYYRERGAVVNFNDIAGATAFEAVTRNRLKLLADQWARIVDDFTGTSIATIDSTVGE